MTTAQQLPLRFRLDNDATFDNFYVSDDAALAVHEVRRQAEGAGERFIALVAGVGRSHLLQASCVYSADRGADSRYIPLSDMISYPPSTVLDGADSCELVCLDDIHLIPGNTAWEKAVFDLYNRSLLTGCSLLVSSRLSELGSQFNLCDLQSRLQSFATYSLPRYDDEQLVELLIFRGNRRGLNISQHVAKFILRHSRRDLLGVVDVLSQLDDASFRLKKPITVPLVKAVFQW